MRRKVKGPTDASGDGAQAFSFPTLPERMAQYSSSGVPAKKAAEGLSNERLRPCRVVAVVVVPVDDGAGRAEARARAYMAAAPVISVCRPRTSVSLSMLMSTQGATPNSSILVQHWMATAS
jgi:hypothetical protein